MFFFVGMVFLVFGGYFTIHFYSLSTKKYGESAGFGPIHHISVCIFAKIVWSFQDFFNNIPYVA